MGCDGGTIPKRHELVKGPKKVEKVCCSFFPSISSQLLVTLSVVIKRLLTVSLLALYYNGVLSISLLKGGFINYF